MGSAAPSLLSLAAVRLAHRRSAVLVVAGGVAVAAGGLLGASVAGIEARDRAISRGIEDAPAAQRSVRASIFETSGAGSDVTGFIPAPGSSGPPPDRTRYATQLDPETSAAMPREGFGKPIVRGIVVAPPRTSAGAGSVRIVGLDDLRRWAAPTSGRLPAATCTAHRCEAVHLGGGAQTKRIRIGKLELDVVGRATLDPAPVGAAPPRDPRALGADSAFYAVRGVAQLAALSSLDRAARTYTWMRELDETNVHPWNVGDVLAAGGRARATVVAGGNGDFTTPAPLLEDLDRRGRASSARIGLIVGQAAAILLAFAAFAAAQRRNDVTAELDRLLDAGAARRHLWMLVGAEALALALAGTALAAVAVVVASELAGAGDALAHAPSSPRLLAGVVLAATAMLAGAAARRPPRRVLAVGEAAVWVALGLIAWQAISRGALDASDLAGDGGADPAILVLPTLVGLAGAALVVRLLPALLRVVERATRRAGAGMRLYALGLARNAGLVGTTVATVSVAAATGLFALAYASELRDGTADQAAYATGGDLRVRERPPPGRDDPDVLPLSRFARLQGVRSASPVIRVGADRLDSTGRSVGAIHLLGARATSSGWRDDFSSTPAAEIDRRLGPPRSLQLHGDALGRGARRVTMPIEVSGDGVTVTLTVQTHDQRFTDVQLLSTQTAGRFQTDTPLPAEARGGRLVAVRVDLLPLSSSTSDYGGVRLGTLRSGGRRVTRFDAGWSAGEGAELSPDNGRVRLSYPGFRQQRRFLALHDQPGDAAAIPALVSRDLAAAPALDGRLPLAVAGGQVVRIRPVATAERFPTLPEGASFAVVDAGALFAAVNLRVAGAALPTEMWLQLDAPERAVEAALRRPPFRTARVTSRAAAQAAIAKDPLGTVTLAALWATALVSLGLAAAAMLLSVLVALRDEAGQLAELEAIGIAPRSLRRLLRASAATTALAGGAGAIVSAAVLSRAFLGLAQVSAEGRDPLPPLISEVPWGAQAAALAVAAAAAALAVLVASRRALRGDRVGRLHG